jgi:ribosomal protein L16/L10AE
MATLAEKTRTAYANAKTAPREGKGTGRPAGSAGRIANEWLMLTKECKEQGVDWRKDP